MNEVLCEICVYLVVFDDFVMLFGGVGELGLLFVVLVLINVIFVVIGMCICSLLVVD